MPINLGELARIGAPITEEEWETAKQESKGCGSGFRGVILARDPADDTGVAQQVGPYCCEHAHNEWWAALRCAQRGLVSARIVDQKARPERSSWRYRADVVDCSDIHP